MPEEQKGIKKNTDTKKEKKIRVNLTLSPTAITGLDKQAQRLHLSRSEYVEQVGRGLISMVRNNNLSEDFIISSPKSISIDECDKLPDCISSFLVTNLTDCIYVGSTANLKEKFADKNFRQELNKIGANEKTKIIWMKCKNSNAMYKTEQELLSQLRSTGYYQNFIEIEVQSEQTQPSYYEEYTDQNEYYQDEGSMYLNQ